MNVRRLLRPAAASLLSAALVAGGCGAISPYAARVNGVTLSQRALDGELRAILANKQYVDRIDANRAQSGGRARGSGQGTFDSDFVAQILTRGILYEVIGQGLAHRHLKVTTSPSVATSPSSTTSRSPTATFSCSVRPRWTSSSAPSAR